MTDDSIKAFLAKKARKSPCTVKIAAIAFDKRGKVLGHVTNSHSVWEVTDHTPKGRPGTGKHAEQRLLARYGDNVKTIVICRVGHSGIVRPVDPCPACSKLARKYGVRIVSVCPGGKPKARKT